MKDAIGGSLLLNLVVIFTSIIILFFAGILAYSKAYKVKNKIIEVIEKEGDYVNVMGKLSTELQQLGYIAASKNEISNKCGNDEHSMLMDDGQTDFLYCVYYNGDFDETGLEKGDTYSYKVVTYVHFAFPVIGDLLTFPVRGETKLLGKTYDY